MAHLTFLQPLRWNPYGSDENVDPATILSSGDYEIESSTPTQFTVISNDSYLVSGFTVRVRMVLTAQTSFTYDAEGLPVEAVRLVDVFGVTGGGFSIQVGSLDISGAGITLSDVTSGAVFFTGADTFTGSGGDDMFFSGPGGDTLNGAGGDDLLIGLAGADILQGNAGEDTLHGRGENDTLRGGADNDLIGGDDGDDTLLGEGGRDHIVGGDGADTIFGASPLAQDTFGDVLLGEGGDDFLYGSQGDDWLVGGLGDDTMSSGTGINVLNGGDGRDLANFAQRSVALWIDMSAGHFSNADTWATFNDLEGAIGGSGADTLLGTAEDDRLAGGAGGDTIVGRGGGDTLIGDAGDDWLMGDAGEDRLTGGEGIDTLTGGAGGDIFDLGTAAGWDVVRDFDTLLDRIDLGGLSFQYIAEGDFNGDGAQDTQLTYAGGAFVAQGVSGLTLEEWNGLVV